MRGWFLGGEGDELRVLELEGHFEGEGAGLVGDEARCYSAVKAGGSERRLVGLLGMDKGFVCEGMDKGLVGRGDG